MLCLEATVTTYFTLGLTEDSGLTQENHSQCAFIYREFIKVCYIQNVQGEMGF